MILQYAQIISIKSIPPVKAFYDEITGYPVEDVDDEAGKPVDGKGQQD